MAKQEFNCYDCKFCKYAEYGFCGICTNPKKSGMIFENLNKLYYVWEEPIGALATIVYKNCPHFIVGERQAIQKQIAQQEEKLRALKFELFDFDERFYDLNTGYGAWIEEEPYFTKS